MSNTPEEDALYSMVKMCIQKMSKGMGFRDIHCLNLALLAKRAWQLIENLDSLCAMVLQERYYPSGPLNTEAKKVASIHGRAYAKGSKQSRKNGHMWRVMVIV